MATASEGVLSLMRSAGCREIGYGFESYSPVVLKSMRKTVTPEQMDIAIRLTFGQKIAVAGNFIFGDVAETLETANKTLDYWVKNCQSQLNLQLITPYPGSKIYEYCVNKGIIADKLDFIKRGLLIFNSNMTTGISNRDYIKLRARIIGFSQRYFKCVIPKLGEQTGRYRSVVAICPFCGESTSYDYCKITNGAYYSFSVVCRHCYKHFWVASLLHCLVLKYARSLIPYYIIAIKVLRLNLLKKGNLI